MQILCLTRVAILLWQTAKCKGISVQEVIIQLSCPNRIKYQLEHCVQFIKRCKQNNIKDCFCIFGMELWLNCSEFESEYVFDQFCKVIDYCSVSLSNSSELNSLYDVLMEMEHLTNKKIYYSYIFCACRAISRNKTNQNQTAIE